MLADDDMDSLEQRAYQRSAESVTFWQYLASLTLADGIDEI